MLASLTPQKSVSAAQQELGCQTEVTPLVYEEVLGKPLGSVGRLLVAIEPNPQQKLRLAFFESEVSAAGPLWRVAGWTAVMYSSLLLAVDPDAYRVTFDIEGSIDGPSAGALITSAVVACLLGDTIQPHMTITGTLHPDGTVGPVGGIYYKLQGAAEAGLKIVLIPKGQRFEQVDELEERVDLLAYGRELGLTVREVGTFPDAYKALTRRALPLVSEESPMSDVAPLLPAPAINRQLLLLAKAATQLYRIQQKQLETLPPSTQRKYDAVVAQAEADFQRANQAITAENGAVAYDRSWHSLYALELVRRLAHVEELKAAKDLDKLTGYLDELITDADYYYGRFLDKLNGQAPRRQLDAVTYAAVHQMTGPGAGLLLSIFSETNGGAGNDEPRTAAEEFRELLDVADWLVPMLTRTRFLYVAAHEILNAHTLENELAHPASLYSQEVLDAMDEIVGNFAETNLEFLYYVVDDADERVLADNNYQNLLYTTDGLYFLENEFVYLTTESARRGLHMRSFIDSTIALTRYYMLEFDQEDDTKLTLEGEMLLEQMVSYARHRAWQNLASGLEAIASSTALYHYALADSMLTEELWESRLQMLGHYWQAALEAQLLGWLSGEYDAAVAKVLEDTGRYTELWEWGRVRPSTVSEQVALLQSKAPLVNEEFASSRRREELFTDEDGAIFIQRERLHVRVTSPNQLIWYHTDSAPAEFLAQVEVAHVEGDPFNGAGLIFGYVDDNNLFEFLVGVDGYYQLAQLADGEWMQLVEWRRSDAIQMGNRMVNQIGLLVDGTDVTLMANGIVLEQLADLNVPQGELLLVAETFDSDTAEFAFDNFRVQTLKPNPEKNVPSRVKIGE